MRINSLKTVQANYTELMEFFDNVARDHETDSSSSAKAAGFYTQMDSFHFLFFLTMMIELFDRIEILNKDLQNSEYSVNDSYQKVEAVKYYLIDSRESKFDVIWEKCIKDSGKFGIDEPQLPRRRKLLKRYDFNQEQGHLFSTPKEMFQKMYFEVFDQVITSLEDRFDTNSARFFKSLEAFATGKSVEVEKIIEFYQDDFDESRLKNDLDMFLRLTKRNDIVIQKLKDIVDFFRENESIRSLLSEYLKFVQLLMTIPGSSCTNERSFSVLRRLKNYLRATMTQNRLNDVAILHIYSDLTDTLDVETLLNEFISKNPQRSALFAMK